MSLLRLADVFPKTLDDFKERTLMGAAISVVSVCFITLLVWVEVSTYLTTLVSHELKVDTTRGGKLLVNFDVSFMALPCGVLSLDAMDGE